VHMRNESEEDFRKRVTYNPRDYRADTNQKRTSSPLASKSTGLFIVVFLAIAGLLVYLFDRYPP